MYKSKYLKYKMKYLNLTKNLMVGGDGEENIKKYNELLKNYKEHPTSPDFVFLNEFKTFIDQIPNLDQISNPELFSEIKNFGPEKSDEKTYTTMIKKTLYQLLKIIIDFVDPYYKTTPNYEGLSTLTETEQTSKLEKLVKEHITNDSLLDFDELKQPIRRMNIVVIYLSLKDDQTNFFREIIRIDKKGDFDKFRKNQFISEKFDMIVENKLDAVYRGLREELNIMREDIDELKETEESEKRNKEHPDPIPSITENSTYKFIKTATREFNYYIKLNSRFEDINDLYKINLSGTEYGEYNFLAIPEYESNPSEKPQICKNLKRISVFALLPMELNDLNSDEKPSESNKFNKDQVNDILKLPLMANENIKLFLGEIPNLVKKN
jgi:hypothetical protein